MFKATIILEETVDNKIAVTFSPSLRHVLGDTVKISAAEQLFEKIMALVKALEKGK